MYGKCSWMDLGEHSWSMVKREVSSSPGSPAEHTYLPGDRRDASVELRTPPGELDVLGPRRADGRSLHSYLHFGHAHGGTLSAAEDLPLFTDLDQGSKLVLSAGAHKAAGLLVDPADMYQTLAIAAAQSQTGYESSSAGYMHSNPNSPVYVPSSRVNPMISSLPYLQAGGSAQPGHVSGHAVWSQSAPESPSYSAGSPHTSSRFHYPPSPPMNNGTVRDSSYSNTLNVSGRDQYGLSRPLSGTYASPYSPYVAPQLPSPWTGGAFDNTMLHTLQSRSAPLIRGPNGGKRSHQAE